MPGQRYRARDGIDILAYLKLNITETERRLFIEGWEEYSPHIRDPIEMTAMLYSKKLPEGMLRDPKQMEVVSKIRSADIWKRIDTKKLKERLQTKTLEKVLRE